jgi:serine/threonine protein kinase
MPAERSQRIEQLYHAARERDPNQRAAFLDQACAGDEGLRREVESLLAEDDGVESFLETPALELLRKIAGEDTGPSMIERQLGSYQCVSLLGKGGMGEVYRARDTKLKRDVAIKILPEEFSRNADRASRFRREAEVLAALNHPNIAAIHSLEEVEGTRFLVLEFVEGETLAERIGRGPIPLEEALSIARNICEALEVAHEKGITHRDLKPANIKLTPDGKVKVLDFGLAKVIENAPSGTTVYNSPTLMSTAATNAGVILGTAAYMAPEQAKGKTVDRRADIWAFGVVLYEMLTGRMLFSRETVSETMAAVIVEEPDWTALPANIPARVRDVLRRCLVKEPRNRVQAIGDARITIEEVQGGAEVDFAVVQAPARRRSKVWAGVAAVFFLTTISFAAFSILYINRATPPEIRLEVSTPSTTDPFSFAISPDGRRLVFVASNEGKSQLWVRPLDSVTAQPLAGTEGATYPFWSPDSATIGFFADAKLKRIDIVGGAPQVLTNARGPGGAWNREGTIVFASSTNGPLLKVRARGGEALAVTRLETGQAGHKFPQFLPDGRHFIYFVQGQGQGVYSGSLNGGSSKLLANTERGAAVSASVFLLFLRQNTLFAQAFDFKRLELSSNTFPVAEQVAFALRTFAPGFSATSGIVAYRTVSASVTTQLTWLDRSGKRVGAIGAPDSADLRDVELSPDGKRVAVGRTVNGNRDVWLIDVARGVPTRFTFNAENFGPVWSPDGSRVVFNSKRKGINKMYWKSSSGSGADELLLESDQANGIVDWSSDGRFLLFASRDPQTGPDLWVLPISGDKKPFPFLKTPFDERTGKFSPDGKWIAYQSNESGRSEIYVQPFPGPGGKFQISTNGGAQPRWNKNGKEIFYVSLDSKMMAAPVKLSPDGQSLETGTPAVLFPVRIALGPAPPTIKQQYAVSSDGERFLVNLAADEETASPITVIYNWKPRP